MFLGETENDDVRVSGASVAVTSGARRRSTSVRPAFPVVRDSAETRSPERVERTARSDRSALSKLSCAVRAPPRETSSAASTFASSSPWAMRSTRKSPISAMTVRDSTIVADTTRSCRERRQVDRGGRDQRRLPVRTTMTRAGRTRRRHDGAAGWPGAVLAGAGPVAGWADVAILSPARPCSRRRGRLGRSRVAPGLSRSWSAAAGHAR